MSLTPYVQASTMYTVGNEVATREAMNVEEQYRADYAIARRDYKLRKERFSTRSYAAPVVHETDLLEELSSYTSSRCPSELNYYYQDQSGPDIRDINKELLERARLRHQEDKQMRLSSNSKKKPANRLEVLMQRQQEEYEDIVDIEATHFRALAKVYYNSVFGEVARFVYEEERARETMEDIVMSVELGHLANLREQIFLSEEKLMIRAMGLYPLQFLRKRREDELAAIEDEEPQELDIMYAVPLDQRADAIRTETINEEEITFLNLNLGFLTQLDLIKKGYLRTNPENGNLEIVEDMQVPLHLYDTIRSALVFERLSIQVSEESARMHVVEESQVIVESLFAEFVQGLQDLQFMEAEIVA